MSKLTGYRQVVLVTTRAEMDIMGKRVLKDNIFALAWHMPTSFEPMMYAISAGKTRFSTEMIRKSKVFCINFMPEKNQKEIIYCGSVSGRHTDKFSDTKLSKAEAVKIECPFIKEALGHIECEVVDEMDTGDHIILIGKVLHSELKKEDKRLYHLEKEDFSTTLK